jgi:archaellum component FlaG (FlaF/FlaG flagellin family)
MFLVRPAIRHGRALYETCVSVSRVTVSAGEVGFIITVVIAAFAGAAAGTSVTHVLLFMNDQRTPKARKP